MIGTAQRGLLPTATWPRLYGLRLLLMDLMDLQENGCLPDGQSQNRHLHGTIGWTLPVKGVHDPRDHHTANHVRIPVEGPPVCLDWCLPGLSLRGLS